VWVRSGHPPRPNQPTKREHHNTSNQKQKDRYCQIGLLLEFLDSFTNPRRSLEKDCTNKEKERIAAATKAMILRIIIDPCRLARTLSKSYRSRSGKAHWLAALLRPAMMACEGPLSAAIWTSSGHRRNGANDPSRTSAPNFAVMHKRGIPTTMW
jgi:hypothetical protein